MQIPRGQGLWPAFWLLGPRYAQCNAQRARFLGSRGALAHGVSACSDERTEGTGFEPVRACAQRFSRPPPYQLGLALPTIQCLNLRESAPTWESVSRKRPN